MIDPTNTPPSELSEATNGTSAPSSSAPGSSAPSASFQPDDLHDLIHSPDHGDAEDPLAALRLDPNYSALIRDLEYIASQARLLFEPTAEGPSDDLWAKIESQLPTKSKD